MPAPTKADGRCKCGRLVYNGHTDAAGKPTHPCCARVDGEDCGPCNASDAAERQWLTNGVKWARRVKAHWKAEAERAQEEEQP